MSNQFKSEEEKGNGNNSKPFKSIKTSKINNLDRRNLEKDGSGVVVAV